MWTVLLTEVLDPQEFDLLLVREGFFCWVALLLDFERVLVQPLFPFLDLACDLSFSNVLTTALTISVTLPSFAFLWGLPRELDLERLRFGFWLPFPRPGEREFLEPCCLFWFSVGLCSAEPDPC